MSERNGGRKGNFLMIFLHFFVSTRRPKVGRKEKNFGSVEKVTNDWKWLPSRWKSSRLLPDSLETVDRATCVGSALNTCSHLPFASNLLVSEWCKSTRFNVMQPSVRLEFSPGLKVALERWKCVERLEGHVHTQTLDRTTTDRYGFKWRPCNLPSSI